VGERKALVLQLYQQGLEPQEMATLKIGNYKTILADIHEIQDRWLANEPEWYDKSRLAKKMAEAQLTQQLRRLFAYLADENGQLNWKEKFYVEQLIQGCIVKIYEITSSFDPIHYRKMVIEERKTITLEESKLPIRNERKDGDSGGTPKETPRVVPT